MFDSFQLGASQVYGFGWFCFPADDMSAPNAKEGLQAVGINSILPKENSSDYVQLPIIKSYTEMDNVC